MLQKICAELTWSEDGQNELRFLKTQEINQPCVVAENSVDGRKKITCRGV